MQMAGDYGNKTVVAQAPAPTPVTPATSVTNPQSPAGQAAAKPALPQAYVPPAISMAEIYKDPTILAFLRSSGLSEQVAANEIARRQTAVNQALATNLDDLGAKGVIERRNIDGSQEARGMFRSGQTLQRGADQQAQEARIGGAMQQQAQNQVNDLAGNLTMMVAQNQQKAAELGTSTYVDRALQAGQNQIDANYANPAYGSEDDE